MWKEGVSCFVYLVVVIRIRKVVRKGGEVGELYESEIEELKLIESVSSIGDTELCIA